MDESSDTDMDDQNDNVNTYASNADAKENADTRAGVDEVRAKIHYARSSVEECSKFNSMFMLSKMHKLLSKLSKPQRALIRRYGFGSILKLSCTSLPNPVALFLAKHYDPQTRTFKLPGGGSFSIDSITIHQLLGIPYGGKEIPAKPSAAAKAILLKDTNQSKKAAKIDDLICLVDGNLAGDKFIRIFLLIVLGIFLCPSSNSYVSFRYYEALTVVKDIPSYDWCSAVAECIHSGLSNFLLNASKGNTSGKATLAGCLFALVAAYFDYLDVNEPMVEQTLPRIAAWTDKSFSMYQDAVANMKHIQIKPIASTLFSEEHVHSSSFRGFYLPQASKAPAAEPDGEATNNIQAKKLDAINVNSKSINLRHNKRAPPSDDIASARKFMPTSSHSSLNILFGEAIHPDVEKIIESSITGTSSTEVKETLKSMCKSFFKDSVQQYVQSVEPIIVSQCCDMVKSFCSGLDHARANNAPPPIYEKSIESDFQPQQKTCNIGSVGNVGNDVEMEDIPFNAEPNPEDNTTIFLESPR